MSQNNLKTKNKWRSILLYLILFMVISIGQTYVSMYKFSDNISGDLKTGYLEGIIEGALVCSVLYLPFVIFITRIKSFRTQVIIHSIIVVLLLLIQSHSVFVDREAGWSTYTFSESVRYTVRYSFLPVLVSVLVFCVGSRFIYKKILANK